MMTFKKLLQSALVIGAFFNATAMAETDPAVTAAPQQAQVVQSQVTSSTQPQSQEQTTVVGDKLNINTASASEIQNALTGIGAKKAEAIVQYREKHGNFTAAEQLLEVQGIGKATLEKNIAKISF